MPHNTNIKCMLTLSGHIYKLQINIYVYFPKITIIMNESGDQQVYWAKCGNALRAYLT